jgi:glycosyltransferase involved in cell wall biosynthesis
MVSAVLRGNRDVLKAARDKDIIYIPGVSYFPWAAIAIIKHRLSGGRVAYQFHDLLMRRSAGLRLASLFVTDFIHCSQLGFKLVSDGNPYIRSRRNHILPYRTGSPRVTNQATAVNGHFEGKVNLLFFGQVSRHKGVDILLEAFEKVASEFPNTILHIAGGYSNAEFETACTEFMTKEHLKQRIKYWGFVEDIEQLLRLANIHVHPSPPSRFMDTFPLAALESMRHGVPTVCFESGGLPEMIIDGVTGVICRDESVDGLVDGMRKLLSRPQLINLYSRQAADRYQELYSEEPVKRAWLEAFSETSPE